MHPLITSLQNPKIKTLAGLTQQRQRKMQGVFSIEGIQEVTLALAAGYNLEQVFFCPEIISENTLQAMGIATQEVIPIAKTVFEKIAYRKTTGGIVAIAHPLETRLDDIPLPTSPPLILVLQGIEKPGNLGALLRTADAAGVDAVIVCDAVTDLYNPNVIRSSIGCLFTNRVVSTDSNSAMRWLTQHKIETYAASLKGTAIYRAVDYRVPCAILMGSENKGLSEPIQEKVTQKIIIPMRGKIDSMNVSVAAGIILFEAVSQRATYGKR